MAAAIQQRLGVPISVVTSFQNENTAYPPLVADSQTPPNFVYGPSAFGVVKNLNLNSPVITGLTSGMLRSAGFDTDSCGEVVERFVLRVFSADAVLRHPGPIRQLQRHRKCRVEFLPDLFAPRPINSAGASAVPDAVPVTLFSTVVA